MTKYICKGCHTFCILDIGYNDVKPMECPYGDNPEWELMKEDILKRGD